MGGGKPLAAAAHAVAAAAHVAAAAAVGTKPVAAWRRLLQHGRRSRLRLLRLGVRHLRWLWLRRKARREFFLLRQWHHGVLRRRVPDGLQHTR